MSAREMIRRINAGLTSMRASGLIEVGTAPQQRIPCPPSQVKPMAVIGPRVDVSQPDPKGAQDAQA